MQIYTHQNRRIVQHSNTHYDIEELRPVLDKNGQAIYFAWAVIDCENEDDMNGYTRSIPLKTRLENLMEQIPQEFHVRAAAECMQDDGNPHDFERYLTSYVMRGVWETNPADVAHALEQAMDAESRIDSESAFEDVWSGAENGTDIGLTEDEQIKDYFGKVKVTASDEWRKRHLNQW